MLDLNWILNNDRSPDMDIIEPEGSSFENLRPEDLPSEWRVEWEERAAIREYDGGQAREHAEAEALTEILDRMSTADEMP